jgi:hypothetical protein
VVTDSQLRVEYHPASNGTWTKTPDDAVTVDLASDKIVHYSAPDMGTPADRAARAYKDLNAFMSIPGRHRIALRMHQPKMPTKARDTRRTIDDAESKEPRDAPSI